MALTKLTDIRKSLSVEVEDLQVNGITTFTGSVSIGGTLTYQDVTNIDSVGIITARGNVEIGGYIKHLGDTNTMIGFPSNDSFSVTTNNVTRMTFTGNFIDLPDAGTFRLGNSNDLQIYHGSGGASNIVHSNTSQPLRISATGAGTIAFDTNSTERLRITSNGKIGIGTANPTFAAGGGVHLQGGNEFTSFKVSAHTNTGVDFAQDATGVAYVYNRDNADLILGTNNAQRLRITSGGKVNIGGDYTSTTSTLRVLGDSNAGSQTYLEKNSGSTNNTFHTALTISARSTGSAAANYGPAINFQHAFGASNYAGCLIASQCNSDVNTADLVFYPRNYAYVEKFRITSAGKVGIGTNNPSQIFNICGTNVKPVIGHITAHTPLYSAYNSQNNTTLEISSSGTGTNVSGLALNNPTTSANTSYKTISFSCSATSSVEKRGAIIGSNHDEDSSSTIKGNLSMMVNNGSGLQNAMLINHDSYVTKPNQPSFHVHNVTGTQNSVLTFGSTHHNNGSHMNAGTGTFTCPVDGRYLFTFAFLHNTSPTSYARVLFQLNGTRSTTFGDTLCDDTGLYINTSMSMIFNLSTNDTVRLYNEGNNIYSSQYGAFSGCLLF